MRIGLFIVLSFDLVALFNKINSQIFWNHQILLVHHFIIFSFLKKKLCDFDGENYFVHFGRIFCFVSEGSLSEIHDQTRLQISSSSAENVTLETLKDSSEPLIPKSRRERRILRNTLKLGGGVSRTRSVRSATFKTQEESLDGKGKKKEKF